MDGKRQHPPAEFGYAVVVQRTEVDQQFFGVIQCRLIWRFQPTEASEILNGRGF